MLQLASTHTHAHTCGAVLSAAPPPSNRWPRLPHAAAPIAVAVAAAAPFKLESSRRRNRVGLEQREDGAAIQAAIHFLLKTRRRLSLEIA